MPISFAGVNTLLPDQGGRLKAFIDRYLQQEWSTWWYRSAYDDHAHVVHPGGAAFPLPRPNWPDPPPPRVNTLYWPTGATRWGAMILLATEAQKDSIVSNTSGSNSENDGGTLLLYDDGFGGTMPTSGVEYDDGKFAIAIDMFALPARPVSIPDSTISDDETLWLIPLVDKRYWLQWETVGRLSMETIEDWDDILDLMPDSAPPEARRDDITEGYAAPKIDDRTSLDYVNAAVLIDAVALSTGRRYVVELGGDDYLRNSDDAASRFDSSTSNARVAYYEHWIRIAGGEYHDDNVTFRPQTVTVRFMGARDTIEEIDAADLGYTKYNSGQKVITVPEVEDEADTEEMATAIATDYHRWLDRQCDQTFAGLKPWLMSGYEDYVSIEFGSFGRGGQEYMAQTRVVTLPENFGFASTLAQGVEGDDGGDGGDFPSGYSGECDCLNCIDEGVALGNTECADFPDGLPSTLRAIMPELTDHPGTGGAMTFEHDSGCRYETDTFEVYCFSDPVSATADTETDVITSTGHGLSNDDRVRIGSTLYYVVNATTDTFQVSETSGGSAASLSESSIEYQERLGPDDYLWVLIIGRAAGEARLFLEADGGSYDSCGIEVEYRSMYTWLPRCNNAMRIYDWDGLESTGGLTCNVCVAVYAPTIECDGTNVYEQYELIIDGVANADPIVCDQCSALNGHYTTRVRWGGISIWCELLFGLPDGLDYCRNPQNNNFNFGHGTTIDMSAYVVPKAFVDDDQPGGVLYGWGSHYCQFNQLILRASINTQLSTITRRAAAAYEIPASWDGRSEVVLTRVPDQDSSITGWWTLGTDWEWNPLNPLCEWPDTVTLRPVL